MYTIFRIFSPPYFAVKQPFLKGNIICYILLSSKPDSINKNSIFISQNLEAAGLLLPHPVSLCYCVTYCARFKGLVWIRQSGKITVIVKESGGFEENIHI